MASLLCRPSMCGYHSGEGREASLILRQAGLYISTVLYVEDQDLYIDYSPGILQISCSHIQTPAAISIVSVGSNPLELLFQLISGFYLGFLAKICHRSNLTNALTCAALAMVVTAASRVVCCQHADVPLLWSSRG